MPGERTDFGAQRDDVERLLEDGVTIPEIAARYAVSRSLVYYHLGRWGVDHRSIRQRIAPQRIKRAWRPTTDIDPIWLRGRYLEDGATMAEIAAETGRSSNNIYWLLKRHGIPTRKRGQQGAPIPPDAIRALLTATGQTQAMLALEIGCSTSALNLWLAGRRSPTGLYRRALTDRIAVAGIEVPEPGP